MKQTKLQRERANFTRSNSFIRSSRQERFERIHANLTERLRQANSNEFLRQTAEEMVKQGYYSPKGAISAVEHMLVVKLFRLSGAKQTFTEWQKFVRAVAPAWAEKWTTKTKRKGGK